MLYLFFLKASVIRKTDLLQLLLQLQLKLQLKLQLQLHCRHHDNSRKFRRVISLSICIKIPFKTLLKIAPGRGGHFRAGRANCAPWFMAAV